MMGPDFVKWLYAIEIRDNIHVRKSSFELDRLSRGVKPHKRKWIYKETNVDNYIHEKVRIVKNLVYDKIQGVDYDKIWIFRSDA